MGREVRRVPANWQHPRYTEDHPEVRENNRDYLIGRYIGLVSYSFEESYEEWKNEDLPEWEESKILWENGYVWSYPRGKYDEGYRLIPIQEFVDDWNNNLSSWDKEVTDPDFYWWAGDPPEAPSFNDYMPNWPESERTHFMMYETTSEGTPLSPAFATPEELAHWLADNGASAFAEYTATYDEWLATIGHGWAVSAVIEGGEIRSGVAAMAEKD